MLKAGFTPVLSFGPKMEGVPLILLRVVCFGCGNVVQENMCSCVSMLHILSSISIQFFFLHFCITNFKSKISILMVPCHQFLGGGALINRTQRCYSDVALPTRQNLGSLCAGIRILL